MDLNLEGHGSHSSFFGAVKWAYLGNWGEKLVSALFIFLLAKVLGPQDFGIVGIGIIYINFLQMLLDQGFQAALVQRKRLYSEHLDSVFCLNVSSSLLLAVISILLSGWWARMNHAPEAGMLISVLSVCLPIQGLSSVQNALLARSLNFKALSIRTNAGAILGGCIGIVMALSGFGMWALVGQQITRDVVALILLWRLSPWRPRLAWSNHHIRDLFAFSSANVAAQLAVFADMQATSVLLGLLFGPVAVGLYRLADRVVNTVVTMATSSIQGVALPEFARLQDKPTEMGRSVLTCIWLSATITLPALTGLAAISKTLMIALGPKWVPATAALQALCIVGVATVFSAFTAPLLQALSRPHQLAVLEWSRAVLGMLVVILSGLVVRRHAVSDQVLGIAFSRLAVMGGIVGPVFLYILTRTGMIPLRDLVRVISPSVLASIVAAAAVWGIQMSGLMLAANPWLALSVEVATGGLLTGALLLAADGDLRALGSRGLRRLQGS